MYEFCAAFAVNDRRNGFPVERRFFFAFEAYLGAYRFSSAIGAGVFVVENHGAFALRAKVVAERFDAAYVAGKVLGKKYFFD